MLFKKMKWLPGGPVIRIYLLTQGNRIPGLVRIHMPCSN